MAKGNDARMEKVVPIEKGYGAHTVDSLAKVGNYTKDTPSGIIAGLDNYGKSYVPSNGKGSGGKD